MKYYLISEQNDIMDTEFVIAKDEPDAWTQWLAANPHYSVKDKRRFAIIEIIPI